jgi:agmatine deiminase
MDRPPEHPRWPAEWEPHRATWLAWPHQRTDWPGKFAPIPWVYAEIVRHLHQGEMVGILVTGPAQERRARSVLSRSGVDLTKVEFHAVATDRVWTRDSGPIFVETAGERLALDWRFTGWAKYPNHLDDDQVPARLAAIKGWRTLQPHFNGHRVVLEGGAVDGNGAGLLLTTEECLLSDVQCRNPGLTRGDYERLFEQFLGVKKVLWLNRGITGDDTHGHVDDLARFVGPRTIVAVVEDNPADANYAPLRENFDRLRGMTDLEGKGFDVIPLPMPEPLSFGDTRLPVSYANFYIANDRVLVPTFNSPRDRVALGTLADLFSTRQVVGIHAVDLVWGFGTLHCMTQQEPA